ncbi:chemotaxis protein CheX [Geomonas limicola]|uniref:Chemotaxis protein CheX n=1 Tax=Geomonas limicola TaxID=2740186 RepID=A0A6V8NGD2_9BACT|nr:chemotaxis protein CheX [Geomonas limicola]GFO70019.1 chemotaxis protein CheX [Geomonas limicola]
MAVKFFGQYLVEKGVVSREAIVEAIALQDKQNLKLGEMAIAMGLVTPADIERAHQNQLSRDMKLGDLLVGTGILSEGQLAEVVARQKATHLYIGEALVQVGALDNEQLARQLEAFKIDQAPYLGESVQLPPGLANSALWEMAVDLTYKLVTRVLGLRFRPGTCQVVTQLSAAHQVAALDFAGDAKGRYLVAVSAPVQKKVAQALLHTAVVDHEPLEVLEDCLLEFINVVCGNVAAKASQQGSALSINPPVNIHPPATGLPLAAQEQGLCFPIHLEDGDLMELYLVLPK